jgi:predicted HicB family RNase H-like nuclease
MAKAGSEKEPKDVWIGARVDPEFKTAAKMRASETDGSMSDYIERLIREDLENVRYADV